jgi:hypothetical protein
MLEFDIKSDMPTVAEAAIRLKGILLQTKGHEKIIKIIHGYGSSGVGGAIKNSVHRILSEKRSQKYIRAFIPGEAIAALQGFDQDIIRFKHLIQTDSDFKKGNDGITYVIF